MLSDDLRFLQAVVADAHPDLIDVSLGRVVAGRLAAAIADAERLERGGGERTGYDLAMGSAPCRRRQLLAERLREIAARGAP